MESGPVLTLGEALVEFFPVGPERTLAGAARFEKHAGGAPVTCAAAVARLGWRAGLIGRVGADSFSDFLLEALQAEGVDTSQVQRVPDRQIGLCFHQYPGEKVSLLFYRRDSAASTLCPEDIDAESISQAAALHVPGVTLQISESARAACLKAARLAREAGVLLSFDPNVRTFLGGGQARQAMEEMVEMASVVTPTLEEAQALTGESDPLRAALRLRERGPRVVAVTLAEKGAVLVGEGQPFFCPGYRVQVVEPTGAGDAHAAALMVALLEERGLEYAGRFANAAGALAVTATGHLGPALPTRERIAALMGEGAALTS
jgi:2-dehydro-3-deoxygluconokinase